MGEIDYKKIYEGPNTSFYDNNPIYTKKNTIEDVQYSEAEDEGMSERKIRKAAFRLRYRRFTNSLIISRNQKIVWQEFFNKNNWRKSHNIHSVSKSILSVVIGIAIDKHLFNLDNKIFDLLPEMFNGPYRTKVKELTVRHLIEMTAGYRWSEDYTEYKIEQKMEWVKSILNRPFSESPGESFNYNSGLTHALSAVIQKTSGLDLCQFTHKYLINPLGLSVEQWSWDPQNFFCGGFNFYMCPNDLLKFSHLILQKGLWKGDQIVSSKWLDESLTPISNVEGIHYAKGWWIDTLAGHKTIIAWGYGGQFIFIVPELNLSVVITGNTTKYGSDFDARTLMRRYIIPSVR